MFGFTSKQKVLTEKLCEEFYGPWLAALKLPPNNVAVDQVFTLYKTISPPNLEGNEFQDFIYEIVAFRFEIYCHVWQMLFWNRISNLVVHATVTKNILSKKDELNVWEKMLKYNRAIPDSVQPSKMINLVMSDTTKKLDILQCDSELAERIVNRSTTTALMRHHSNLHRKLADAFHMNSGWNMSTNAFNAIACLAAGFYQCSHSELKSVNPLD